MASSIETLREQNIARNKNFLKDLGLEPNNVVSKSKSSAPSNKKVSMSKVVLRRSPRTANIAVDYSDDNSKLNKLIGTEYKSSSTSKLKSMRTSELDGAIGTYDVSIEDTEGPDGKEVEAEADKLGNSNRGRSCKYCNADMEILLNEKTMGTAISQYGKLAMVSVAGGSYGVPKFSKYAGALQWNNAVFIWVNFGAEQNIQYNNKLYLYDNHPDTLAHVSEEVLENALVGKNHCVLTWYGNSKMHHDSEMTRLILKYGYINKSHKNLNVNSNKHVLLFVRMVNQNYTCLGRLGVISCKTSSPTSPLEYTFLLKDYKHVCGKAYFNTIYEYQRNLNNC